MTSKGYHLRLRKGEIVNNEFQIIECIGCGNFSKVYSIFCIDNVESSLKWSAVYAMKVVKKEYKRDAIFERRILELLEENDYEQAERFCKLIKSFVWNERTIFIMPMYGPSLRSRRLGFGRGNVNIGNLTKLSYELLLSLKYLHDTCHIVHTDLKPENILIKELNPLERSLGEEWVICDFGSSSVCCMDKLDSDLISTRPYRAPEVILGNPWYYPADMWSLGCILYEVAAGNRLFEVHDDFAHLQLMVKRLGKLPDILTTASKFSYKFFNSKGEFLHRTEKFSSPKIWCCSVREIFRHDSQFCSLLLHLLALDPAKRWTAVQALQHSMFKELRSKSQECIVNDTEKLSKVNFNQVTRADHIVENSFQNAVSQKKSYSAYINGESHHVHHTHACNETSSKELNVDNVRNSNELQAFSLMVDEVSRTTSNENKLNNKEEFFSADLMASTTSNNQLTQSCDTVDLHARHNSINNNSNHSINKDKTLGMEDDDNIMMTNINVNDDQTNNHVSVANRINNYACNQYAVVRSASNTSSLLSSLTPSDRHNKMLLSTDNEIVVKKVINNELKKSHMYENDKNISDEVMVSNNIPERNEESWHKQCKTNVTPNRSEQCNKTRDRSSVEMLHLNNNNRLTSSKFNNPRNVDPKSTSYVDSSNSAEAHTDLDMKEHSVSTSHSISGINASDDINNHELLNINNKSDRRGVTEQLSSRNNFVRQSISHNVYMELCNSNNTEESENSQVDINVYDHNSNNNSFMHNSEQNVSENFATPLDVSELSQDKKQEQQREPKEEHFEELGVSKGAQTNCFDMPANLNRATVHDQLRSIYGDKVTRCVENKLYDTQEENNVQVYNSNNLETYKQESNNECTAAQTNLLAAVGITSPTLVDSTTNNTLYSTCGSNSNTINTKKFSIHEEWKEKTRPLSYSSINEKQEKHNVERRAVLQASGNSNTILRIKRNNLQEMEEIKNNCAIIASKKVKHNFIELHSKTNSNFECESPIQNGKKNVDKSSNGARNKELDQLVVSYNKDERRSSFSSTNADTITIIENNHENKHLNDANKEEIIIKALIDAPKESIQDHKANSSRDNGNPEMKNERIENIKTTANTTSNKTAIKATANTVTAMKDDINSANYSLESSQHEERHSITKHINNTPFVAKKVERCSEISQDLRVQHLTSHTNECKHDTDDNNELNSKGITVVSVKNNVNGTDEGNYVVNTSFFNTSGTKAKSNEKITIVESRNVESNCYKSISEEYEQRTDERIPILTGNKSEHEKRNINSLTSFDSREVVEHNMTTFTPEEANELEKSEQVKNFNAKIDLQEELKHNAYSTRSKSCEEYTSLPLITSVLPISTNSASSLPIELIESSPLYEEDKISWKSNNPEQTPNILSSPLQLIISETEGLYSSLHSNDYSGAPRRRRSEAPEMSPLEETASSSSHNNELVLSPLHEKKEISNTDNKETMEPQLSLKRTPLLQTTRPNWSTEVTVEKYNNKSASKYNTTMANNYFKCEINSQHNSITQVNGHERKSDDCIDDSSVNSTTRDEEDSHSNSIIKTFVPKVTPKWSVMKRANVARNERSIKTAKQVVNSLQSNAPVMTKSLASNNKQQSASSEKHTLSFDSIAEKYKKSNSCCKNYSNNNDNSNTSKNWTANYETNNNNNDNNDNKLVIPTSLRSVPSSVTAVPVLRKSLQTSELTRSEYNNSKCSNKHMRKIVDERVWNTSTPLTRNALQLEMHTAPPPATTALLQESQKCRLSASNSVTESDCVNSELERSNLSKKCVNTNDVVVHSNPINNLREPKIVEEVQCKFTKLQNCEEQRYSLHKQKECPKNEEKQVTCKEQMQSVLCKNMEQICNNTTCQEKKLHDSFSENEIKYKESKYKNLENSNDNTNMSFKNESEECIPLTSKNTTLLNEKACTILDSRSTTLLCKHVPTSLSFPQKNNPEQNIEFNNFQSVHTQTNASKAKQDHINGYRSVANSNQYTLKNGHISNVAHSLIASDNSNFAVQKKTENNRSIHYHNASRNNVIIFNAK